MIYDLRKALKERLKLAEQRYDKEVQDVEKYLKYLDEIEAAVTGKAVKTKQVNIHKSPALSAIQPATPPTPAKPKNKNYKDAPVLRPGAPTLADTVRRSISDSFRAGEEFFTETVPLPSPYDQYDRAAVRSILYRMVKNDLLQSRFKGNRRVFFAKP